MAVAQNVEDELDHVDKPVPSESAEWHMAGMEHEKIYSDASEEDEESRGVVADFLISLEMTRPEILRAVQAGKVLSRFGRVLRFQRGQIGAKGLKTENLFKLSTQVKSIDVFWSHSWKTSKFWKIWLLLMLKNGVPACLIGSLVACIFTFLSFMQYVPGWSKEPLMTTSNFDGEYRYSCWALLSGSFSALLTLLFRRPSEEVFVDMACIHQGDPDLKSEGVLNIGAFLKNSKKLLVLWDSTFSSRAWCMFEVAAFLQSHRSEVNLPIDVKPVVIAPATFAFVVGNTFMLLCEIILPAGGFFRFLRFVYLVPAIIMIHIFHKHWCEVVKAEQLLSEFCWAEAQCTNPPDKEVLTTCVVEWFGSVEHFEEQVRTEVRKVLFHQVARFPLGYKWMVVASTFIWWAHLDVSISRGAHLQHFLGQLAKTIPWQFWISPAMLCFTVMLSYWIQRQDKMTCKILGYGGFMLVQLLPYLFDYVCWLLFPTMSLFALSFSISTFPICALVLWLFARRSV